MTQTPTAVAATAAGMATGNPGAGFLGGSGEMAQLLQKHDWAATTLGAPSTWPQALRTAVRLMLNSGHPMYIFWGAEAVCLYNDGYRRSIGPERHPSSLGAPGRQVWDEIWPVIGPQFEQVMAGGGATWHENQLVPITRHGVREDVYWTYSYSPIDDEQATGGIGGVLVVCTETTSQVLLARSLVESQERLQLALSAGRGIGTWDWDVPGNRVFADEHFACLYGVDPARARAGAPVAEFFAAIHPVDLPRVRVAINEALRTGDAFSQEYRLVRAEGKTRWVSAEGRCHFDANHRPLRFPGVSFDITSRKATEQKLRDLNADLERRVIERSQVHGRTWQVSPDLLGALNSRGYFETLNPAWQSVLGWSEQEVASLSIFEMVHPDDLEIARAGFALTQAGEPAIGVLIRNRCKNGGYRWISWVGVPEGGLVYCSGRDITEEREQALALERAEAALRQAHKMEAVGQLTGGLAHDFNNLLAAIHGSLEMIERRVGERRFADIGRYMAMAQGATRRATSLTHRLLAFARQQTLDPRPTDVNRLVVGIEELIQRTVGPTVHCEVLAADDLWATLVDSNQLENALLNLCINARDAMPEGGCLTIETANQWLDQVDGESRGLSPGPYVSLCVTDDGTGMTPEVVAKAIDPFFTTKPLGAGTGLGLSMVYGFAHQSGGQVWIRSALGQGTAVSIYLPRHEGDADAGDAQRAVTTLPVASAGRVVLLIDDEEMVRTLVADVLQEAGYTVIEAADGPSGLRVLESGAQIDLLVTDVGLPGGLNGRQVADAARALRSGLKVVFITGYADNAVIGSGHLERWMAVVTKPFEMDGLVEKIGQMLAS